MEFGFLREPSNISIISRLSIIRYDTTHYIYVRQKLTNSQLNLPHETKQKKSNEESKTEKQDAQKKGSVKSVESVVRPEGSLWWERFVKEVGICLEPGVKERESYGWWEW